MKRCFTRNRFDAPRFIELMGRIAQFDAVQHNFTSKSRAPFIGALISSLMRKTFTALSMTARR